MQLKVIRNIFSWSEIALFTSVYLHNWQRLFHCERHVHRNPKLRDTYISFCLKFEILFKIRVRKLVKSNAERSVRYCINIRSFRRMESYFLASIYDDLEIIATMNLLFFFFVSRLKQLKIFFTKLNENYHLRTQNM